MSVCISHRCAAKWLVSNPNHMIGSKPLARSDVPAFRAPLAADARCILEQLGVDDQPLDVLVPSVADRRSTSRLKVHVCQHMDKLPTGSFIPIESRIDDVDLYVTSPELTLAHLANRADGLETIFWGMAFCSEYRLEPLSRSGVVLRTGHDRPLTDTRRLRRFLKQAGLVRGASFALRLVPHMLERSRSPRESGLAMFLGLGTLYGGNSLGTIQLNPMISIYDGTDRFGGRKIISRSPDLLILPRARSKQGHRVLVDYDSDSEHLVSEQKAALDSSRRNELMSLNGINYYTVTTAQANSYRAMVDLAERIRRNIGARPRPMLKGNRDSTKNQEAIKGWDARRFALWHRFVRISGHAPETSETDWS